MSETVTSLANPTVKRVRALSRRKYRRRENAFVVEGLQPVWHAVTSTWPVDTLVVAPDLVTNPAALTMVGEQQAAGVRVVRVDRAVFESLSGRDGPTGLIAIVRGAVGPLDGLDPAPHRPVVALYRAANPGNIGTVLRSADAAGAAGLVLVGDTGDPLAPAAVKASMGSLFAVPLAHTGTPDELLAWAADNARPVIAVTGAAADTLWRTTIPDHAVLLLGSEGDGLPEAVARRCAARVAIPMEGTADSLNLATAASIVLFDLQRRRAAADPAGA